MIFFDLKKTLNNCFLEQDIHVEHDFFQTLSFLIAATIVSPGSKSHMQRLSPSFLGDPLQSVSLKQIYSSLTVLANIKDSLFVQLNQNTKQYYSSEHVIYFFDCTNYFFETPYTDQERLLFKFEEQEKKRLQNMNKTQNEIQQYFISEQYIQKRTLFIENHQNECFRARGKSKEKREDLPLVLIALVINSKGIPIDFHVYEGNKSEFKTLPVAINRLASLYNLKDIIFVADRGLNSKENLQCIASFDFGFILSHRLSFLRKDMSQLIYSAQGWSEIKAISFDNILERVAFDPYKNNSVEESETNIDDVFLNNFTDFTLLNELNEEDSFGDISNLPLFSALSKKDIEVDKADFDSVLFQINNIFKNLDSFNTLAYCSKSVYKVIEHFPYRTKSSKGKDISLDCSLVVTFSPSRFKRDMQLIRRDIIEAKQAVLQQRVLPTKQLSGKLSLVKFEPLGLDQLKQFDLNIDECMIAKTLKLNTIKQRIQRAGFGAIIYRSPKNNNIKALDALSTYANLVKIEDKFKVLKSNLHIRPAFVYTKPHIVGHCTIAFLALYVLRFMIILLKQQKNTSLTEEQVINILKQLTTAVTHEERSPRVTGFTKDSYLLNKEFFDLWGIKHFCTLDDFSAINNIFKTKFSLGNALPNKDLETLLQCIKSYDLK